MIVFKLKLEYPASPFESKSGHTSRSSRKSTSRAGYFAVAAISYSQGHFAALTISFSRTQFQVSGLHRQKDSVSRTEAQALNKVAEGLRT